LGKWQYVRSYKGGNMAHPTPFINFITDIPIDLSIIYKNEPKNAKTRDQRISSLAFRIIGALATLTALIAALAGISMILNARILSGVLMLTFAAATRVFGSDTIIIGTNQRAIMIAKSTSYFHYAPDKDAPPLELKNTAIPVAIYELLSPESKKKVEDYFDPPAPHTHGHS
jgi:hypothetical protein